MRGNVLCTFIQTYILCKCTPSRRCDQICLVKFLFTFPFLPFRGVLHRISLLLHLDAGPLFSLRSFLRGDVGGRYTVPAIFAHFNTRCLTSYFLCLSLSYSFPLSLSLSVCLSLSLSIFLSQSPYRDYNLEFNSQLSRETTSRFQQKSFNSEREISPRDLAKFTHLVARETANAPRAF